MKIEYYEAKSLIRTGGSSIFSWAEYYLNPYQGCFHDCVYCDGKSEHYHMHEDFGGLIKVKENAPALFKKFLKDKGYFPVHKKEQFVMYDFFPDLKESAKTHKDGKAIINIGGGVCDVYQPVEKEVKMTRELMEIVYDYKFPLWILTKNNLVLEDIDLLKKINKDSYAVVNFTITLADEKAQKIFEPGASSTQERFDAIKALRKEGIHSGVYFYPALPFIGDTIENVEAIYKQAKEVGAEFIYSSGLTLKPGRSKDEYMNTIRKHYPDLYQKYELLYGNNNKYGMLDVDQFKEMGLKWSVFTGYKFGYELKLGYTAERYVPEGRIANNLKLAELLLKIGFLKSNFFNEPRYEVQKYSKAAKLIENARRDYSIILEDEFETETIDKQVVPILSDYLEKGESKYLNDLEKKAYEHVNDRYF
jgi:DNA repair photolyase